MLIKIVLSIILCVCINDVVAQNNRIITRDNIGWYNFFGTVQLKNKWGIHTEYQWRRDNVITDWQQSLLRVGVNYRLNERVLFRAGYGWIETFPYGEIPINALGRDFTEHRIFEMVQLKHKEGIFNFSHRFMLEQRFVGNYRSSTAEKEDIYTFLNRARYMVRLKVPLKGKELKDKTPYAALYDELFIGFGENVKSNVFDQNRLGILVGYRFNKNVSVEGGYLNQIVQLAREINNQNVFQQNNGLIINAIFNIDPS